MRIVKDASQSIHRLLIVMPSWVGDVVMATPTLRALRELLPEAHIAALVKANVKPLLDGCPWVDRVISSRPKEQHSRHRKSNGPLNLARHLSHGEFDTAILLTNSFRTALLTRMAGIPRRIGYDRDGRGFLLTDRLLPRRKPGGFIPVSARDYYLGVPRYLGMHNPSAKMELFTRPADDAKADALLKSAGFDVNGQQKLIIINPGASFGSAKMWYADRFAQVADMAVKELNVAVAISGGPGERAILNNVKQASHSKLIDLPELGVNLRVLKSVIKRGSAMVTNDTGPRHIATAIGIPVVTIFGPTDPAWSETDFSLERKVRVDVFCSPCQKKTCPLDHRCMKEVTPEMVFEQLVQVLGVSSKATAI